MCPVIVTGVSHNVTPEQYLHWPVTYRQSRDPPPAQDTGHRPTHTKQITLKIWSADVELMHPVVESL